MVQQTWVADAASLHDTDRPGKQMQPLCMTQTRLPNGASFILYPATESHSDPDIPVKSHTFDRSPHTI